MQSEQTKSAIMAAEVAAYLKSRANLIWIQTGEESRVESYLFEAAASAGYAIHFWDVAAGVTGPGGEREQGGTDPGDVLDYIRGRAEGGIESRDVFVLRDIHSWLEGPGGMTTLRQLRNLARNLPAIPRKSAQAVIIIAPVANIPPELQALTTVIDWPLPDRAEVRAILESTVSALPESIRESAMVADETTILDACLGLSGDEVQATLNKSLVRSRRIEPAALSAEKKRLIEKSGLLEYIEPLADGLESVGGLSTLKGWLGARAKAYTAEARDFGLPLPRGCVLVGVPGGGKSLTAKAVASAWQIPCLRVDLGALKSKFVGDSEQNIRRIFNVIEAVGRCVVWLDEIEKALGGAINGAADGGVSADALGSLLTWLQERKGSAFCVVTANDVSALPPELLRRGRFDEVFFVDLAGPSERAEIVRATLKKHGRAELPIDAEAVAAATSGFTGAELAELVPAGLFAAFNSGRELCTEDLIAAARDVVPLSVSQAERIAALRKWAETRARRASPVESTEAGGPGGIDI